MPTFKEVYPWTTAPLIVGAPMRPFAGTALAHAISAAGGFGFVGAGTDMDSLAQTLSDYKSTLATSPIPNVPADILPIGFGFLLFGADLSTCVSAISAPGCTPAAVWLFAATETSQLKVWADKIRDATAGKTKIWVQVSTVAGALEALELARPDVLVIQGCDAGGHGRYESAGLISFVPEAIDAVTAACAETGIPLPGFVAAGGIADSRGVAAVQALGAAGAALGTRFLASEEAAGVTAAYRDAVLKTSDGGRSTTRTDTYDPVKGTKVFPEGYGGRWMVNEGGEGEVKKKMWAGTGVGLVKKVMSAADITRELRGEK
ncbi:hypothetical protein Dda_3413 [Drechslerella dactyloides]|uniref:Nitronate monooxygenase domain-containing protein n=1 Tax=Drechslerella dactyloides TaxID=74499 RepID=A0AAD6J5T0_DREDA|nr:hypothetical protein Dda_3413 [Drechslerella dactyloides]